MNTITQEGLFDFFKRTNSKDLNETEKDLEQASKDKSFWDKRKEKAFLKSLEKTEKYLREKISPMAKVYVAELDKTNGSYRKRTTQILESVRAMEKLVKEYVSSVKDKKSVDKMALTYLDACEMLFSTNFDKMFTAAYKQYKSGNVSIIGTMTYYEYICLIYFVETMTLILAPIVTTVNDRYSIWGQVYSSYYTFTRYVVKGAMTIVKKYDGIKDPYGNFNKALTAEKKVNTSSNESVSAVLGAAWLSFKALSFAAKATYILAFLVIVPTLIYLAVDAIRTMMYSIGCMQIDISKSLIDQSHMLLVNINELKEKLAGMDPDSKEAKALQKTIESQEKWVERMINTAKKIADVDTRSVDDIRSQKEDDDSSIEEEVDSDDDSSSGGSFDL